MNKIALVTGATSGIGKAIAKSLAIEGYNLIITGRRESLLKGFSLELESLGVEVLPLVFDVRDKSQVYSNLENLPEVWVNIELLVNNAGLAVGLDPINSGVIDDWERMIDTNVKGLLYVSKVVSQKMIDLGIKGRIINIGSIAGKEAYPNGSVYCATKHGVDAISTGMRMDLISHGIRVSQICPGAVNTEFSEVRFKGDKQRADSVYNGFEPLMAEDVADALMYIVKAPAHVNIADMLILPTAQASATIINKVGL